MGRLIVAAGILLFLTACNSPEASRVRGGSTGGDVGNRASVELHGGSEIYHRTPVLIPDRARGGTASGSRGARPAG